MLVYEVKHGYYAGSTDSTLKNPELQYTKLAPPPVRPGEYAMWIGKWVITTCPPMPPEPKYDPVTHRLLWLNNGWQLVELAESDT